MAAKTKEKIKTEKVVQETWRKPLQVPPRADTMRSFYQGPDEIKSENIDRVVKEEGKSTTNEPRTPKIGMDTKSTIATKKNNETKVIPEIVETGQPQTKKANYPTPKNKVTSKLKEEEIFELIGCPIEDLFDVHELLRGKSFNIYRTLLHSSDDKGRCKITQLELMRRTAIKNRRTFYKHEDWLINLKLLEKRHLPGDHKGVVYRVINLADALDIPNDILSEFNKELKKD